MPSSSQAQQKFMGMVHATQKGGKPASGKVAKVASRMDPKDAKDFASTKHKGLPMKKKQEQKIREYIQSVIREVLNEEKIPVKCMECGKEFITKTRYDNQCPKCLSQKISLNE